MSDKIDDKYLARLASIMEQKSLTKLNIEMGDVKISLEREGRISPQPAPLPMMNASLPMMAMAANVHTLQGLDKEIEAKADSKSAPSAGGSVIKSPMVGTVYLSPKPGDPPYVKIGDKITEGQTLMVIEAMKVMNPITAQSGGTIEAILVENEDPVEFGQPLIRVV